MKKFNAMTASEVEFLDYLESLECEMPGCVSGPNLMNALVEVDFDIEQERYADCMSEHDFDFSYFDFLDDDCVSSSYWLV